METEAKFIVPDAATYAKLRRMPRLGPYKLGKPEVKTVQDSYVDTDGRHFFQQRFAVRLRAGDGGLRLTLKNFGERPQNAIHSRTEIESIVPGRDITAWPAGEARKLAEEIAGHEPLMDLVSLDQNRVVAPITDGIRLVAEWSLDTVTLAGADTPFYELEIELRPDGRERDLRELSDFLTAKYGLRPQPQSKFERAVQARPPVVSDAPTTRLAEPVAGAATPLVITPARHAPTTRLSEPADAAIPTLPAVTPAVEEPAAGTPAATKPPRHSAAGTDKVPAPTAKPLPGIVRTDPMAVAGRKILRLQWERLQAVEQAGPVHNNPDAVHDMRVASRRMRAALPVFTIYEAGGIKRTVRQGLRDLARTLGAVRDLDVLIDHAELFHAGLPIEQQDDMAGLLAHWQAERERAQHALQDLGDSTEYRQLKRGLRTLLSSEVKATPAFDGDTPLPFQVRHVAGGAIWTQYEAVRAYEAIMKQVTIPQLHALRITGKYLRYTLEFFREVLPADAGTLIADVVEMQDQLGALHDAEVAADRVRVYSKDTHGKHPKRTASPVPPGLAAYLAERERAAGTIHHDFALTWTQLTSPQWRSRLAAAIAAI